jgi:hypothetical protein
MEPSFMSHGFRKSSGRALCLLAVLGLLAAAAPGCGESTTGKQEAAAGKVPTVVQDSNKNMENFMKSQAAKKQ